MQYSIVKLSEVRESSNDFSIHSEAFLPKIINIRRNLIKKGFSKLGKFAKYIKSGHQPLYNSDGEIPVIRPVNVRDDGINNTRQEFVTEEFMFNNLQGVVGYNDVLLNCSGVGTLGRCAIYKKDEKSFLAIDTLIIKNLIDINPDFLYVYLNTKFAQAQINSLYKGTSGIIHLYPDSVKQILIKPLKIQNTIATLVNKSHQLKEQAKDLYQQAEELLLEELDLVSFKPKHKLSYIKNFAETQEAKRFDAEYFQPKYEELEEKIKSYKGGFSTLGEEFDVVNGRTPISYCDTVSDIQVLKTKQIRSDAINYSSLSYTKKYLVDTILEDKDILFASMGVGSLGRTAIFYNFETNLPTAVDSTVKIFRKNGDILPEVAQLFLNLRYIQVYIYRYIVGSTGIISIKNESIENLKLPIVKDSTQQSISHNIYKSHLCKQQAKHLLEVAKRAVEIAIEESEEKAEEYIKEKTSDIL